MEKKKPKVFANTINKELNNNERVFYSKNIDVKKEPKEDKKKSSSSTSSNKNINQKINSIFNSSKFVYKAQVDIKTKSGFETKTIIGKNRTNIITIDNELIPISDIEDIKFSN